ncbi:hypothetical protein HMPREF0397_1330 [Fusobacterium nucleatum subsp. nucleatum ATCC 23726]|uniref:DUF6161 domain-containing protein n=1 Tax=Fusobacterium nucleatum subsp. nucleatum (strain ATCC 23726 / VPI 4351) TaxID=525283 RepID=D5RDP5_FUSN2|nr:metal ABC transporter [Fusobacterium nucleatum subsp. nucleatum ATCC 23726]EFG95020.1 hypothetical protein HMPREF0397_1330 [Fusobacterium nucleatum subsp. nucleatum ATCC 23726]
MENIKVKIWDVEPSELLLKIKEMLEKQKINVTRESEEEYDIVISSDNDYKNKSAIFIQGSLNPKCSNEILAYLSIIADKLNIIICIKEENLTNKNLGFKVKENYVGTYNPEMYRMPIFIEDKKTEIYRRLSIITIFKINISPTHSTENIDFECSLEELENILEINYNIWKDLYQDGDDINYLEVYQNLKNKIFNFFTYFTNIEDITDEILYSQIYYNITNSNEYFENKRKYLINIEAPINKDKNFIKIIEFYKYYQEQKFDNISHAIEYYILIYRRPEMAGNYLNNTNLYCYYPAFYYLKEQFNLKTSNTQIDDEINILKKEMSVIEETIPKRKNEILNYMEAISKGLDIWKNGFLDDVENWKIKINKWQKESENKINALEKAYNEKLKLEAPEKLWNEKAKNYGKAYVIWLLITIVLGIGIVFFTAYTIKVFYFNNASNNNLENEVFKYFPKTFLFLGILSLALYILRVVIKIVLSNTFTIRI